MLIYKCHKYIMQGIKIHGSMGAPRKKSWTAQKNGRIINKNPEKKKWGPQNANCGP